MSQIWICDPEVSDKEASYLQVKGSELGRRYLFPKIQETFSDVVSRLGISNCGTAIEHISDFLDHHLNSYLSNTQSYVKDIKHLLLLFACLGEIPDDALPHKADVFGLLPSIHHDEVLRQCNMHCTAGKSKVSPLVHCLIWIELLWRNIF